MIRYQYDFDWLSLLIMLAFLIFFIAVARRNVKVATNKKAARWMEIIRLALVMAILVSLLDPMRISVKKSETKPVIKILRDVSGSMETKDLQNNEAALVSRAEKLTSLKLEKRLRDLSSDYEFELIDFSGSKELAKSTDIKTALSNELSNNGDLRGVLLLSDGTWNSGGDPAESAELAKLNQVPIYSVGFGEKNHLPDLKFERVDRPSFGIVKEKIVIPFAVRNHLSTEFNGQVRLSSGGIHLEKSLSIPAGGSVSDHFLWQPRYEGDFKFTMELPVFNNEVNKANNKQDFNLNVRAELLKVLVIESLPRWEYRYMRNAMMRDPGVALHTYLTHQAGMKLGGGDGYLSELPDTVEAMSEYDVIFIGDVGLGEGQLSQKHLELIQGLVEKQGSGLVFLPGMMGQQASLMNSPLEDLLPVVYDKDRQEGVAYSEEIQFELSSLGSEHMLTMLADTTLGNYALWKILPGYYWSAAVERIKAGTEVLAYHGLEKTKDDDAMPVLAIATRGNGQVLYLGTDSAWRWRRGVEDKYHYRFWGQVVRWMSNRRHAAYSENVRLFLSPSVLQEGTEVNIQSTIFDVENKPLDGHEVDLNLRAPDASVHKLSLYQKEKGWGVYSGDFKVDQAGDWILNLEVKNTDIFYEKILHVSDRTLEQKGLPASIGVMQKLAHLSGGKYFNSNDFDIALQQVNSLPLPQLEERRWRLLNQWWWGLTIVALACTYWILRKRQGLI